jgi:excisionase family DNA binding protein
MTRIEVEYLTTRELAELLRIKERKVYDLASSGDIPCTRATGKLLFPRREVEAWLAGRGSGPAVATDPRPPEVMLGSHDPLLEWALKASGCGLASYFDGSTAGLEGFTRGEGIAAALHLYEGTAEHWNTDTVSARFGGRPVVLAEFCWRERGLIVTPALTESVTGVADLAGRRFVPRQPGAGSQILLLRLLDDAGLSADDLSTCEVAHTETDAAMAVLDGRADAALGLRGVADRFRLGFVPIIRERFDLLVDRRAWFDPPFQKFLRFCEGEEFARTAESFRGYDITGFAQVHFNG